MKILIVIPSLSKEWGGTTTSLFNFVYGLSRYHDIKITVATTILEDEQKHISKEFLEDENFKFFKTTQRSWRYAHELHAFLKKTIRLYDLVWIHGIWTSISYYTSKYAQKHKIPYVLTPHGMFEPDALKRKALKKKLYWHFIEKKVFDNAQIIHCINSAEADNINKYTSTEKFVLANGVKIGEYVEKQIDSIKTIGFIGRLHEKKGIDLLIKTLANIKNIRLLVGGSGEAEYEAYLHKLVDELGLGERVEFLGFINNEEKEAMFKKILFLVVPSYTEVLTFVALESISNSTPVLITEKCNFDDIASCQAGIIIQDNNPITIQKGIQEMLKSDLSFFAHNAYILAKEKYSIEHIANVLYLRFKDIVNEKNRLK